MLPQRGMEDHPPKFKCVHRLDFPPVEGRVDVTSEGDPQWIMGMQADDAGLVAYEQSQLVRIADSYVFGRKSREQKRFYNAEPVGNVFGLPIRCGLVLDRPVCTHVTRVASRKRGQ